MVKPNLRNGSYHGGIQSKHSHVVFLFFVAVAFCCLSSSLQGSYTTKRYRHLKCLEEKKTTKI